MMYKAKPGTVFVPMVSGTIPKGQPATMSAPKMAPMAPRK